jgi:ClpP class serine protease
MYSKRTLTPTKKVTREDLEKSKEDIEEIYTLFRNFVKQNRKQLDMDVVATGETWFGSDALERKLCDEIKTVDDVINEHILNGFDVYQVEYKPPIDETRFAQLLGGDRSSSSSFQTSLLEKPIRWIVRSVASVVQQEMQLWANKYNNINDSIDLPIERKYVAVDDTADRIHSSS